jgi:hypothetical protein
MRGFLDDKTYRPGLETFRDAADPTAAEPASSKGGSGRDQ